jgi:hypothetical protein
LSQPFTGAFQGRDEVFSGSSVVEQPTTADANEISNRIKLQRELKEKRFTILD